MGITEISAQLLIDFDNTVSWPETDRVLQGALDFFNQKLVGDRFSISLDMNGRDTLSIHTQDQTLSVLSTTENPLSDLKPVLQGRFKGHPEGFHQKNLRNLKNPNTIEQALKSAGFMAFFSAPLIVEGELTGSINVGTHSDNGVDKFTQQALIILSGRLSRALHHAQIHAQMIEKERALSASEQEHRELVEQAGDAIIKAMSDGGIVQVNQAATALFGYTRKELLSLNLSELFPAEILARQPLRYDLIEAGQTVLAERRILHKSGISIPVEMNSRKLSSGALLSIIHNLTERYHIQQKIQDKTQRLVDAEEMALLGTWEYDYTNNHFSPSKRFYTLFGIKTKDLDGSISNLVAIIHPDDRKNFKLALADSKLHSKTLNVTYRLLVNNQEYWVTMKGRLDTALHRDRSIMVGSVQDVSALYSTQKALRASEAHAQQQFQLLRSISDNTPNLVWAENTRGKFTFVNKEFCRSILLATSTSEPLGKSMQEATQQLTPEPDNTIISAILAFRETSSDDVEVLQVDLSGTLNGQTIHLRLSKARQRDYKAQVIGHIYSGFDITAQVQQTIELETSRNQIRALLHAVPAPLYAKNVEGQYILLNDAYLDFFGKEADHMLGKTVEECWSDNVATQFSIDDRLLIEKNQRRSYSATLNDGSGNQREVMVHKARYFDANGNVAGLIGTLWDYTELKNAEQRYHNLFDLSPNPIVVHDAKKLIAVNKAALDFFGAEDHSAYLNKPVFEFIHPDFREIAAERSRGILQNQEPNLPMEQKFLTAAGETRDVDVVASPVVLESGVAILASFRDITEEKRNRDLLEQSKKDYRTLIDLTPNPVLVHSAGKIIYANQAALEFGGMKQLSDCEDMDLFQFVHPDTRQKSRDQLKHILETGQPTASGEQRYIRGDGQTRDVESRAVPVIYEGKKAVLVSFVDTTEKTLAKQELQESRKQLEMVTDHVTHFILLVSYDLTILYGNQSSATFFKLNKADMLGLPAEKIIVEPALQLVREHLVDLKDKAFDTFSFTYERKNGSSSQYWVTLIPVKTPDGSSTAFLAQIEDVTDREAARQELAENKELLELIIDTIPALIAYADASEKLLFVNQAYADWHKQTKQTLVGKQLSKIMGKKSYQTLQPHLEAVLAGQEQHVSQAFVGKDKIPFVYEGSFIPHVDKNNQIKAFLTVLRDVSEQKKAELAQTALRELAHALTEPLTLHEIGVRSAQTIRPLFDSDALAIELFDYKDRLNRGIYSEDTMTGQRHPREVPSTDLSFDEIDSIHYNSKYVAECVNRSEEDIHGHLNTIPFGDSRLNRSLLNVPIRWEGNAVGVLSVQSYTENKYTNEDIPLLQTFGDQIGVALMRARQDAEILAHQAAVEREEKKYRSIIENAGDAVFVISQTGQILTVNETAASFLGYASAELLTLNIAQIDPDFFNVLEHIDPPASDQNDETYSHISQYTRKDGHTRPVELRISHTEIDENPCFLIFARDITERIQSESRERALRELAHNLNESKDMRAVGRMAAHSIREFFDSDAFAIEYYDFESGVIVGVYSEDTFQPGGKPEEVEPKDTLIKEVRKDFFKLNSQVHLRNRTAEDIKKIQRSRPFGSGRLSHSLLFAPILWGEKTIGILTVQSYTDNKYSEKDLQDVQLFADQIGGALMRSRADATLLVQTTALLKSEQTLTALLKEKEVLLKEVYHRTKNNMQVIVGLLEMQGYKTDNQQTLTTLKEMTDRISSMSMVHDLLYRSKSLANIRLDTYLHKLVTRLVTAYQSPSVDIDTEFKVESLRINIQLAIPLGLVINEVVTNALKYAFINRRNGLIKVTAVSWKDSGLDLIIGDNGVGLGKDFVFAKTDSLGMKIIHDIVELQLMGTLKVNQRRGLAYRILIPDINLDAKSM